MDRIDANLEPLPAEWRPSFREMLIEGGRDDYDRDADGRPASWDWTIAQAYRCKSDLYFLTTDVLYRHDAHKYGPLHKWMCRTVGKEPRTRQLWLLPRDHFKSTLLTIAHGIQQLLRDPTQALMMLSRKDDHVFTMSDEMRRQFTFNEHLRALFPDWCVASMDQLGSRSEWTSPAYKVITGKRRREPSVVAVGMKSRKQSKHYNWVYPDDCMDLEDTTEVGLRDIREDWKDVIPLIDKDGGVVACGTRKHYNDLYWAFMETGIYQVFVRHGLEKVGTKCTADECSKAEEHWAADLKDGVPLEPARMARSDYDQKLKECEIDPKRGISFFFHEYMNIPFSPTDRMFQPSWFRQVDPQSIPAMRVMMLAVDTAWKQEEHPTGFDYTVVVRAGWDNEARLYIFNIMRSRTWTAKQGCGEMAEQMKRHGISSSHLITEKVGDISWHAFLRDECRLRGVPYSEPLTLTRGGGGVLGRRGKEDRIRAIQGFFETGKVLFSRDCEFFDEAVNEFCNLGKWTNDDIADAISMFFDERVIVRPAPRLPAESVEQPFRPMPFEGPMRRAFFSQSHPAGNVRVGQFGRSGEVAVDGAGNVLFTPEQAEVFAHRPDKQEQAKPAFRMYR